MSKRLELRLAQYLQRRCTRQCHKTNDILVFVAVAALWVKSAAKYAAAELLSKVGKRRCAPDNVSRTQKLNFSLLFKRPIL